jgi:hypothetical protein
LGCFFGKPDIFLLLCRQNNSVTMSQVELYQSVLQKLGQLPGKDLADLDAYLSLLAGRNRRSGKNNGIAHLAGAWQNWDDHDFEDFLQMTRQIRNELFVPRHFSI